MTNDDIFGFDEFSRAEGSLLGSAIGEAISRKDRVPDDEAPLPIGIMTQLLVYGVDYIGVRERYMEITFPLLRSMSMQIWTIRNGKTPSGTYHFACLDDPLMKKVLPIDDGDSTFFSGKYSFLSFKTKPEGGTMGLGLMAAMGIDPYDNGMDRLIVETSTMYNAFYADAAGLTVSSYYCAWVHYLCYEERTVHPTLEQHDAMTLLLCTLGQAFDIKDDPALENTEDIIDWLQMARDQALSGQPFDILIPDSPAMVAVAQATYAVFKGNGNFRKTMEIAYGFKKKRKATCFLAGGLVGALVGTKGLPEGWVNHLEAAPLLRSTLVGLPSQEELEKIYADAEESDGGDDGSGGDDSGSVHMA